MKVCYFGIYDKEYSRNRVLISGLEKNGYDVIECRADPEVGSIRKFWCLYQEYKKVRHNDFDYVIVGFPGHTVVWLARLLFGRDIIFDAFLSLHDSNVYDRAQYGKMSLRAFKDRLLDWYSCAIAKTVLVDTDAHRQLFIKEYNIRPEKILAIPISANENIFSQINKPIEEGGGFIVHFHGSFIPLQGVAHIVRAFQYLPPDIMLQLVGSGQTFNTVKKIAQKKEVGDHISFVGRVPLLEVPGYIAKADICLGIFGITRKAYNVIPNKVYECIAMRKPVVTGDTPAIREIFTDRKDILLADMGDSRDIAEKILLLKQDDKLREAIANNGYELFKLQLTPKKVVKKLLMKL